MTVAEELRKWAAEPVTLYRILSSEAWNSLMAAAPVREHGFFLSIDDRRTFALIVAEALESER